MAHPQNQKPPSNQPIDRQAVIAALKQVEGVKTTLQRLLRNS